MSNTPLTPSAQETLSGLRLSQPTTPFLALGQTALWDEPTKATLLVALSHLWPDARFVAGVHDTDYFAKLPGRGGRDEKFAIAKHDDALTRGLWSAAGEMHRLFGSEDVPSRDLLTEAGVSLHRALQFEDEPAKTLSALTEAWGWTGIIYTEWDRKIARDIRLSEILPTLLEQITWATGSSASHLDGDNASIGETLRGWIQSFADAHPDASLTDLYQDLLPRLHHLLLGDTVHAVETTATSDLLRFNKQTCELPRFAVFSLFVAPETQTKAAQAYDLAVAGSDMYTLDQFGDGATPFDLVVPGQGRGTLRLPGDGSVQIDLPREPVTLRAENQPVHDLASLADLIERELGPNCVVVGKAVSLIPMLAAEFSLVFHEGASGYTTRSRAFVEEMQKRQLLLPTLHPILRVRYHTYSALSAVPNDPDINHLPPYLVQALGRDRLTTTDFANCWHNAIGWEKGRIGEISTIRSPSRWLDHLNCKEDTWRDACTTYENAAATLRQLRAQGVHLQQEVGRLYLDMRGWRRQINQLEAEKGQHFRMRLLPLLRQADQNGKADQNVALRERAEQFEKPLQVLREKVQHAKARAHRLNRERRALETGVEARTARQTMRRIEADAEYERARQTANALRTIHGLPHQNARPSAWWFPLVDPSGAWFARLAQTAEYYLEPLDA